MDVAGIDRWPTKGTTWLSYLRGASKNCHGYATGHTSLVVGAEWPYLLWETTPEFWKVNRSFKLWSNKLDKTVDGCGSKLKRNNFSKTWRKHGENSESPCLRVAKIFWNPTIMMHALYSMLLWEGNSKSSNCTCRWISIESEVPFRSTYQRLTIKNKTFHGETNRIYSTHLQYPIRPFLGDPMAEWRVEGAKGTGEFLQPQVPLVNWASPGCLW